MIQRYSMCGIFGTIAATSRLPNEETVRKATRMLQHRGPDDEGFYFHQRVALGHRRLAIFDLSPKGHQPMSGFGNTLVYNGEIYNYPELKGILTEKGYQFQSHSDTEVILAAYAEWGRACVDHFNGMWAFALYDQEKKQVFCSRDRFGIKPFYYTTLEGDFYFASEIKAFTVLPPWQAILNEALAADFLLNGQQHQGQETLFKDVFQILPGHHLVYDLTQNTWQTFRYYSLDDIPEVTYSKKAAAEKFRHLFTDAIDLHWRSEVPVGTAFSGGLDSSAILAVLYQNFKNQSIAKSPEAVAYCAPVKAYDESGYIDHFQQKYPIDVHRISPDFSQLFSYLDAAIRAQDEPLLSGSLLAQYAVFQEAKNRGLKVMLDGQGADELLAGYGTYYSPFFRHLLRHQPLQLFPELLGLLWYHHLPWERLMPSYFQKTESIQGIQLSSPSPASPKATSFRSYTKEMLRRAHLPALLHFEDRNSMAHGIESRVPFLDHRLVEFSLSLSPGHHIYYGKRKALLRSSLKDLLPPKILHRYDKMGFVTPQMLWMEEHPEQLLDILQEGLQIFPNIFTPEYLPWAKAILLNKQKRYYPLLWRTMTLCRWGTLYLVKLGIVE